MFPPHVIKTSVFQTFKQDETSNDQRLKSVENYIKNKRWGIRITVRKDM